MTQSILIRSSAAWALVSGLVASAGFATASGTIWSPATPDIQGFGVVRLGLDSYFTVGRNLDDGGGDFPTDLGLTVGVLPFEKLQMEIGIDLLEPSDHPWSANVKLGSPEGVLFAGSPALYAGMFGIGTERDQTDYNVAYITTSKTIPGLGRFTVGTYRGNSNLLRSADGRPQDTGVMVAWDRSLHPVTDAAGNQFDRFVFAADYISGDNAIGGLAVGLGTYVANGVALTVAPVWFADEEINGRWKVTVQLDIDVRAFAGN